MVLDEETTARNRSVLLASLDSVLIAELTRVDAVCGRGHDGINEVWSVNKTSRNGIYDISSVMSGSAMISEKVDTRHCSVPLLEIASKRANNWLVSYTQLMRGSNDCRLTKLVRDFLKVESNRVDSGSLNFNRFKFYNSKIKFVIAYSLLYFF